MGRKKGWVMTAEHKQKIAEGRAKAREEKIALGLPLKRSKKALSKKYVNGKPVIKLTGKEKNAFDYFDAVRGTLRSLGNYLLAPSIIRELCNTTYWQNKKYLVSIIEKYFVIE